MSTETKESPKKIDPAEALQRITESYHGLYNGLGYFIAREEGEIAHNETFYQVAMEDFDNAPGPAYFEAVQQHIAELEAQVRTAAPAELVELLDRLSPPGHGVALKGDPTEALHTGHDVYLAQRVRAWLATHESRLRGEEDQ